MSFNITSDGSPTPRKGTTRFSRAAGDLRIDTSPELLGQAVGGYNQNHYPYALHRAFGSSLTANMQGPKRPLGVSTFGNHQAMMPQQHAYDGYKVSKYAPHTGPSLSSLCPPRTTTPLFPSIGPHFMCNEITHHHRSPRWMATTNPPSWIRCCSASTAAHRHLISTTLPPAQCQSPRPPKSSDRHHPRPWTTPCFSSMHLNYRN
jgi:hypothetical protein